MDEPRCPGLVPDDDPEAGTAAVPDPAAGPAAVPVLDLDSDGDDVADTAVVWDGVDLVVHTDLDGDGFADQVLRIGGDGVVRQVGPPSPGPGDLAIDGMLGGAAASPGSGN